MKYEDLQALRYNRKYVVWRPFMEKYNCQVIAEIGVRHGTNFRQMIKHSPRLAFAIDVWHAGKKSENDMDFTQEQLDAQYESLRTDIGHLPGVRIMRENSHLAHTSFPDEFFDLIYIDADHTYEGCSRDIEDWYRKVKKGGVLIGDDYVNRMNKWGVKFGVIDAVNEFAEKNKLSYFVYPFRKWAMLK